MRFSFFPKSISIKKFYSTNITVTHLTQKILNKDVVIRTMTNNDLDLTFNWAEREGWWPCYDNVKAYYAADSEAYHLLCVNGQPAASLASVKYPGGYAFLGLYIVTPEFRGQGYGKMLWDFSMERLRFYSSIALDGVTNQVKAYERSGFSSSNSNTRWSVGLFDSTVTPTKSSRITLTEEPLLESVCNLDFRASAIYRPGFWSELNRSKSYILASKEGDKINGFGVLSHGVGAYRLGPIYAHDEQIAEDIILALWKKAQSMGCIENVPLHLDTTELNLKAEVLAKKLGFKKIFNTTRMYKGIKPEMDESTVYGLATLDIG